MRAGKSSAESDADHLPPFIQEVCPSAPIDIGPCDIEQIAQVGRVEEESTRAISGDDVVVPEGFDTVYVDSGTDVPLMAQSNRSAIVVIDRRDFFRDCFVRCLQIAYGDRKIHSFATIADWCGSLEAHASPVAVVIIVVEGDQEACLADREFIELMEAKVPIVIVSDVDDVDHILGALRRGARGYIPSSLPFNVAVEAVRLVEAGGIFVPASSLVDRDKPAAAAKSVALTERQMEVLEEIRHGKANKQIAYALKMSEHTVKLHLRHIMRKLNARNRTEVAILSENLLAQKDV